MDSAGLAVARYLTRIGFIAALLSVTLAAAHQATAHALTPDPNYWQQTVTRRDTVYSFVYRQSPQTIPTSYSPVSGPASSLTTDFRTLPTSNPETKPLWRRGRTTTIKPGLSPALRAFGTISLAAETFHLGWKIGSGINAKFLKVGIPEKTVDSSNAQWDTIRFAQAHTRSFFGATWPHEDGWVAEFYYGSRYDRWFQQPCAFSGFTPPAPFAVYGPVASTATCNNSPNPNAQVNVLYAWLPEDGFAAPGPIEDYTNQPYDRATAAPTPPAQATVEQRIGEELDKLENAKLRQWLNYKLYSPGEEDPTGIGAPNPDIEFPGFVEHWDDHGDEFTPAYNDPVEYWRDAVEIVKRGDRGDLGYLKCQRSDGALIYWDDSKRAIVIVKDGKIVTFLKPEGGPPADFLYFLNQCR